MAGLICFTVFVATFIIRKYYTYIKRVVCGNEQLILGTVLDKHKMCFFYELRLTGSKVMLYE